MKIKLFSESFDACQNKKLSEGEWFDKVGDDLELINRDEFTPSEVNEIKTKIGSINPNIKFILNPRNLGRNPHVLKNSTLALTLNFEWEKSGISSWVRAYTSKDLDAFNIEIIKAQDEWYYMEVEIPTLILYRIKKTHDFSYLWYKCDGLDGLIQQIKELKIIYLK